MLFAEPEVCPAPRPSRPRAEKPHTAHRHRTCTEDAQTTPTEKLLCVVARSDYCAFIADAYFASARPRPAPGMSYGMTRRLAQRVLIRTRSNPRWRRLSQFRVFSITCAPISSLLAVHSKIPSQSHSCTTPRPGIIHAVPLYSRMAHGPATRQLRIQLYRPTCEAMRHGRAPKDRCATRSATPPVRSPPRQLACARPVSAGPVAPVARCRCTRLTCSFEAAWKDALRRQLRRRCPS